MNNLFARLALAAGVIAALLVAGAAPAYRYAGFELSQAFDMMRFGVYAAGGVAVLAVIWFIASIVASSREGIVSLIAALVLAGGSAYFPINMMMTAGKLPKIHDITTDTSTPPAFVAIAPLRANAPNGVEYKTDPAEQKIGYPDIEPLWVHNVSPADLFKRAEATAKAMGWEIVASVPEQGRIEATDTTAWWGFKDDIVIRIVASKFTSTTTGAVEEGAVLDIRSMSRVGISDIGKNAARIRAFIAAVREAK